MNFELFYIAPELVLVAGGILALAIGLFVRSWYSPKRPNLLSPEVVSLVALAAALVPSVMLFKTVADGPGISQFFGMIAVDGLAVFFKIIAILSTALVILLSLDFFRGTRFHRGEYYALLVFATLAISMMAASIDLVMIYLSVEFLSITSYILTGYLKQDPKSNEAAIKYFLYGSVAGAVMVYGMSILYGLTGTTSILGISEAIRFMIQGSESAPLLVIFPATLMILVGFGFKIAMVPFHQWSPDTYEGAPTPITAFLSVGSKAAGFAVLVRVLGTSISPQSGFDWTPIIILLSGVTMTVGNLIAIPQTNIKRMLAYSSIAQAGYLLMGVAAMGVASTSDMQTTAIQAILLYLFVYLFMNLGAFAVVTLVSARLNSDHIRDYAGLVKRSPWSAVAMLIFLLSLAGIPPTAGFLGKFYLFIAAIKSGDTAVFWLAIVAIANTVVSVYYYFNIVRQMFFAESKTELPIPTGGPLGVVIGLTMVATLAILVYPQPFIDIAYKSARMLGL